MWHTLFHLADRTEHSLREHNVWWLTGVGSAIGMSILFVSVMWSNGTFSPLTTVFERAGVPAALLGSSVDTDSGNLSASESTPLVSESIQSSPQQPPEKNTPPTQLVLIGEGLVRVPVGSAYTDDGIALLGTEPIQYDTFVNGTPVASVILDTSIAGEHRIEYRPRAERAGIFRTVIVR